MPTLTLWKDCLARPTEGEKKFYLSEHLEGAQKGIKTFLSKRKLDKNLEFLLELAAVSHDVGKSHHGWQLYIRNNVSSGGPPHAACGAIFFAYLSYQYLRKKGLWAEYQFWWLLLTRDIADHHGNLKGYAANKELYSNSFRKMDMEGLAHWLGKVFPVLKENDIKINTEIINEWQDELNYLVEDVIFDFYDRERNQQRTIDEMMNTLQLWRDRTTMLIAADRFDIEYVEDQRFDTSDWPKFIKNISKFCKSGSHHPLAKVRSHAQEKILKQWYQNKGQPFYVLEMPTGYGKTITSMMLAAAMAEGDQFSKIIYVAPYLSILEQNAVAIEEATGYRPLQHHSMALLLSERQKSQQGKLLDEDEITDKFNDLYIQSWANPIICTSVVQLMRGIFPSRAQEALRRIYLHNAILVIDEPQIIDAGVWNLFLKGLASLQRIYNLTIIFCSATMPPFIHGLSREPKKLKVKPSKADNRYQIKIVEPLDAQGLVEKLMGRKEKSCAAIVNTVYDAAHIFDLLPEDEKIEKYLLHGLMIPVHKKIQIKKIENALKKQRENKSKIQAIQVISTQILEAGVDLSFQYMYRALPILPSLTQAAGRVNRHKENDKGVGLVETSKFLRNGKDTRYIYPKHLCRLSDDILFAKKIWMEQEMGELVNTFYSQMFTENSYEAILQSIKKAMDGDWGSVSRHEVFDSKAYHRLPLFIPFDWAGYEDLVDPGLHSLLGEFALIRLGISMMLFLANLCDKPGTTTNEKGLTFYFINLYYRFPLKKH